MANTTEKGNKLEDRFYNYLLNQQSLGELVFGAYPSELCKIHKKKRYYCHERGRDIEFDVVIEFYRQGSVDPHTHILFECKNHKGSIKERDITDFSDKIGRIFKHANKGIVVGSSDLQSGAKNIALNRKIGIIKYDEHGLEVIAERKGGLRTENRFVEAQIFKSSQPVKSLKFSAFCDGKFFGSISELFAGLSPPLSQAEKHPNDLVSASVPFIQIDEINNVAQNILNDIGYVTGPVNLARVCSNLNINLETIDRKVTDGDGEVILGSANFDRKTILIYSNETPYRERFTIGHEIGHFCLRHDLYLRSETILEKDLILNSETENSFNYERLEYQANIFASDLLLPRSEFLAKTDECRKSLNIKDRGHGYIFVDNQPCNYEPYDKLLAFLSMYFEVSKQAIEVKLKKMALLTDQRKTQSELLAPHIGKYFA